MDSERRYEAGFADTCPGWVVPGKVSSGQDFLKVISHDSETYTVWHTRDALKHSLSALKRYALYQTAGMGFHELRKGFSPHRFRFIRRTTL